MISESMAKRRSAAAATKISGSAVSCAGCGPVLCTVSGPDLCGWFMAIGFAAISRVAVMKMAGRDQRALSIGG